MFDRRMKNAAIFKDTVKQYRENIVLRQAVENSVQRQYFVKEDAKVSLIQNTNTEKTRVIVSGKRTLEASEIYAKQGKKVCVLNFASATNPGGGVIHGSSAQEEAICRCSTLYPCLNQKIMWEKFYAPHRESENPLHNDDCIYTPGVKVFKSDSNFPELLDEKDWWEVDVITCAAPNLRNVPGNKMNPGDGEIPAAIADEDLRKLFLSRITRIFEIAIKENVEVLVLGAFGCGAFRNPPELVADVFAECTKRYGKYFDAIEYAVFHMPHETKNYEVFVEKMKE